MLLKVLEQIEQIRSFVWHFLAFIFLASKLGTITEAEEKNEKLIFLPLSPDPILGNGGFQ